MSEPVSEAAEPATPGRTEAEPGAPGQDHGVSEVPGEAVSETGSLELVVPGIGEVVNLEDPKSVAFALDGIRDLERQFRYIKAELTHALIYASQREGTKTLHIEGGLTAVVKLGTVIEYDAEAIEHGLREAGMPEARIREIVVETISYKVAANKAKHAASANPAYAAIIEENRREVETPPSVTISRK